MFIFRTRETSKKLLYSKTRKHIRTCWKSTTFIQPMDNNWPHSQNYELPDSGCKDSASLFLILNKIVLGVCVHRIKVLWIYVSTTCIISLWIWLYSENNNEVGEYSSHFLPSTLPVFRTFAKLHSVLRISSLLIVFKHTFSIGS